MLTTAAAVSTSPPPIRTDSAVSRGFSTGPCVAQVGEEEGGAHTWPSRPHRPTLSASLSALSTHCCAARTSELKKRSTSVPMTCTSITVAAALPGA